jgi:hypothetical protein
MSEIFPILLASDSLIAFPLCSSTSLTPASFIFSSLSELQEAWSIRFPREVLIVVGIDAFPEIGSHSSRNEFVVLSHLLVQY